MSNQKTPTASGSLDRLVRLCNAITEALREMEKCPDDSVQDIWNESLDSWETGLRMDHNHNVTPNVPALAQSGGEKTSTKESNS